MPISSHVFGLTNWLFKNREPTYLAALPEPLIRQNFTKQWNFVLYYDAKRKWWHGRNKLIKENVSNAVCVSDITNKLRLWFASLTQSKLIRCERMQ